MPPSQSPLVAPSLIHQQQSPSAAATSRSGPLAAGPALVLHPQPAAAAPVVSTSGTVALVSGAAAAEQPLQVAAASIAAAYSVAEHDSAAAVHPLGAAAAGTAPETAATALPSAATDEVQQPTVSVSQPAAAAAADPPWPDLDQTPAAPAVAAGSGGGGSAKEVQLSRLVETLRKRLDAYKVENQQLEDLLHAAEQRATEQLRKADQFALELAQTRQDQEAIVSSAAASATAQDVQITRLRQELESSKQQVMVLQASLDTLQAQHQEVMTSKDSIEGGALEGAFIYGMECIVEAEVIIKHVMAWQIEVVDIQAVLSCKKDIPHCSNTWEAPSMSCTCGPSP